MPINDLICHGTTARHIELDVLYRGTPPLCHCGAPRSAWWGAGKAPSPHFFRPVDMGDGVKLQSTDEVNAYRQRLARIHKQPVENFQVDEVSRATATENADFHRHRAWERRQELGLDDARVKEIKAETKITGVNPENGLSAPSPTPSVP